MQPKLDQTFSHLPGTLPILPQLPTPKSQLAFRKKSLLLCSLILSLDTQRLTQRASDNIWEHLWFS